MLYFWSGYFAIVLIGCLFPFEYQNPILVHVYHAIEMPYDVYDKIIK